MSHELEEIKALIAPKYAFERQLANNTYGAIILARYPTPGTSSEELVVIKVTSYRKLALCFHTRHADDPLQEAAILTVMKGHPNIVELIEVIKNQHYHAVVLKYIPGGELFAHVDRYGISEPELKVILRQILSALDALEKYGLVNLDLALENIIIEEAGSASEPEKWKIRIIDLGAVVAAEGYTAVTFEKAFRGFCYGRNRSCEPEMRLYGLYDAKTPFIPKEAQVWTLGVVLFCAFTRRIVYAEIGDQHYKFAVSGKWLTVSDKEKYWGPASASFRQLVDAMIKPLDKRIKYAEIAAHPWLNETSLPLPLP